MTAIILDGRKAREHYTSFLKTRIEGLSVLPCLVIIQVGNRADSDSYIKAKKSFAQKMGIKEIHVQLDERITQDELIKIIEKYNNDKEVHGIITQLPLPSHLNSEIILNSINASKDIDGLNCNTKFMPATARGVKELFKFYKINLAQKKVTIVGRSKLVGEPISRMCHEEGAIVTVCYKGTENTAEKTKDADIVILATGKALFFDQKYFKEGQIVVDVGITRLEERLVGDVDFEKVKDIVDMITPVPGGVGQMTVLALFENLIDACYNA